MFRLLFLTLLLCSMSTAQQLRTGFEVFVGSVSFPRMGYQLEVQECFDVISKVGSDMNEQGLLKQLQDGKLECFLLPSNSREDDVYDITMQLQKADYKVIFEDTIASHEDASVPTRIFYQSFQHRDFSNHFVTLLYYLDYTGGLVMTLEE